MSDFKREARYYVIKMKNLTDDQDTALCDLLSGAQIPCTDCVVVEKDWLNYEHTWKTIEHVASGKFCDPYEEIDRLEARVAELDPSAVVPDERGTNEYGLDVGYFRKLFNRELSSLRSFRPNELARVLARAAKTADASVLQENEFQPSAVVPDALRELARWMDTGGPTYHEYEIISMALAGPVFCSDGDACREAARRTFLEAAKLWEANPPKQDIG